MDINDPGCVELHVFGGSLGESIAIRTPDGQWGVVDSYASSLKDELTNRSLQYLLSRNVTKLAFLCLTHPHADHFRGMSQFLRRFEVEAFWQPAAMCARTLKLTLKSEGHRAVASDLASSIADKDELLGILKEVRKLSREKKLIIKNASVGTALFPSPIAEGSHFRIRAIAPSGASKQRYETSLHKCFDDQGRFVDASPPADHNQVSIALDILFGKTRLILGADVETDGWSDVLLEISRDDLSADAVKVSHHGSTNGYAKELWPVFSHRCRPLAICTAYEKYRLPDPEALAHIANRASRILTTSRLDHLRDPVSIPLSVGSPIKSRIALSKQLRLRRPSSPLGFGRWSLWFDSQQRCVREEYEGTAGEFPAVPSVNLT